MKCIAVRVGKELKFIDTMLESQSQQCDVQIGGEHTHLKENITFLNHRKM